ncbi:MAG: hypothetical protein HY347_07880 [candidate division NC10 bacterium]|nr:hypothetical protein [candidate division NC10 bacterium]
MILAMLLSFLWSPVVRAVEGSELTDRVSVSSLGVQANNESFNPALSAEGQYVAFESKATNLVLDDTNNVSDIFFHFSNQPPDAVNDTATTAEDTPVTITVLARQ